MIIDPLNPFNAISDEGEPLQAIVMLPKGVEPTLENIQSGEVMGWHKPGYDITASVTEALNKREG